MGGGQEGALVKAEAGRRGARREGRKWAEPQGPRVATAVSRKKNEARVITLPDTEVYDKATVIRTAWS